MTDTTPSTIVDDLNDLARAQRNRSPHEQRLLALALAHASLRAVFPAPKRARLFAFLVDPPTQRNRRAKSRVMSLRLMVEAYPTGTYAVEAFELAVAAVGDSQERVTEIVRVLVDQLVASVDDVDTTPTRTSKKLEAAFRTVVREWS